MRSTNKHHIQTYLQKVTFSDQSTIFSRASDIIIRDNSITFTIDIEGISITEAEHTKNNIINKLDTELNNEYQIKIILTSTKKKKDAKKQLYIDGTQEVIVVTSGKGGVGKSTISALIAQKLANQNKRVGLIDADIYGPSIPNIFGIHEVPKIKNKMMTPIYKHNIYINSIGFIAPQEQAISWRGPMLSKALYQLISLTKWENLDHLIIDMPPGTGDIHLSLLQNYHINKAITVTTPQKISEIDVIRSINMCNNFNVPIAGIIENMSYYFDHATNQKINIFSGNSGLEIAKKCNLKMLSQIPILSELSKACDDGKSLKKWVNLIPELD